MIFCNIDKNLVEIIKSFAKGRTIIDVGCGEGILQEKYIKNNIISVDLLNMENKPFILKKDIIDVAVNSAHFPVIIRPCHGGFVESAINHFKYKVVDMLYISNPKNLVIDIPSKLLKKVTMYKDWEGNEGERIYHIQLSKEKLEKYILISLHEHSQGLYKKPIPENLSWFKVEDDCVTKTKLRNMGGGYCFLNPDKTKQPTIIKTTFATSFYDLDWNNTFLDVSDWKKYKSGWLDRRGKFYGCNYQNHDLIIYYLLKKDVSEVENKGWVRIHGDNDFQCLQKLSPEQRNFLSSKGFILNGE